MSYDHEEEEEECRARRNKVEAMAKALPDIVLRQICLYLSQGNLYILATKCRSMSHVAQAALYARLIVESVARLDRLMQCRPNPDDIAGYVESLEIPVALSPPRFEYIQRLCQQAHYLTRLKVGVRDSMDPATPAIPQIPQSTMLKRLVLGTHSSMDPTNDIPVFPLSTLQRFQCVRRVTLMSEDARLGPLDVILHKIKPLYPNVERLAVPWSDAVGDWESLPVFEGLGRLTIQFKRHSQINVSELVRCLRVFYTRNDHIKLGLSCAAETINWLDSLYVEIINQQTLLRQSPVDMLKWIMRDNPHHLVKLNNSSARMNAILRNAIRETESPRSGRRLEVGLSRDPLLDVICKGDVSYLRCVINRENVPANYIPDIICANPLLEGPLIVLHVQHDGPLSEGSCTTARLPLLPGQNEVRTFGQRIQRVTTPGVEMSFLVSKDEKGVVKKKWTAYPAVRRGKYPSAEQLYDLNLFGGPNSRMSWTTEKLERLKLWEEEVTSWLHLRDGVKKIKVVINTDSEKFGRFETYWCKCCD